MVAVLGIARARQQADMLAQQAAAHLDGFGERAACCGHWHRSWWQDGIDWRDDIEGRGERESGVRLI